MTCPRPHSELRPNMPILSRVLSPRTGCFTREGPEVSTWVAGCRVRHELIPSPLPASAPAGPDVARGGEPRRWRGCVA